MLTMVDVMKMKCSSQHHNLVFPLNCPASFLFSAYSLSMCGLTSAELKHCHGCMMFQLKWKIFAWSQLTLQAKETRLCYFFIKVQLSNYITCKGTDLLAVHICILHAGEKDRKIIRSLPNASVIRTNYLWTKNNGLLSLQRIKLTIHGSASNEIALGTVLLAKVHCMQIPILSMWKPNCTCMTGSHL